MFRGPRQIGVQWVTMAFFDRPPRGPEATRRVSSPVGVTEVMAGENAALGAKEFVQHNSVPKSLPAGVQSACALVWVASGLDAFVTYGIVKDGAEPGERSGHGAFIQSEVGRRPVGTDTGFHGRTGPRGRPFC